MEPPLGRMSTLWIPFLSAVFVFGYSSPSYRCIRCYFWEMARLSEARVRVVVWRERVSERRKNKKERAFLLLPFCVF